MAIKLKKLCMTEAKDIFNACCRRETIEHFCAQKKTSYMEEERQDEHHPLPTVSAEV